MWKRFCKILSILLAVVGVIVSVLLGLFGSFGGFNPWLLLFGLLITVIICSFMSLLSEIAFHLEKIEKELMKNPGKSYSVVNEPVNYEVKNEVKKEIKMEQPKQEQPKQEPKKEPKKEPKVIPIENVIPEAATAEPSEGDTSILSSNTSLTPSTTINIDSNGNPFYYDETGNPYYIGSDGMAYYYNN